MVESHTTQSATRMSSEIPRPFLERMSALLDDEFPAFLASYDAPPSAGLRVNTLKITSEAFQRIAPCALASVPWCAAGFAVLRTDVEPGKHPYHTAGLYYLQDPSAMAVAELLDPQPGERVLDLAAAPGGKATHIAALMGGDGLLIANEIHPKRAWDLAGNLERWGVRNVAITNETPERLAERFEGFFDRVLLDAPCSGEGMLRKSEAARVEWAPELVHGCALRQSGILEQAARLVRPGGRLAYSTCTFNPEENEGTVARFLDAHPEFEVVEPLHRPGFAPGRPGWLVQLGGNPPKVCHCEFPISPRQDAPGEDCHCEGDSPKQSHPQVRDCFGAAAPRNDRTQANLGHRVLDEQTPGVFRQDLTRAVRLWPHLAPGEGHFIALLRRRDDDSPRATTQSWRTVRLARPVEAAYRGFCAAHLTHALADERLALIGSYLYALPPGLPDLTGLRFLHPGWWLGTIKKDRFEPSHALALGLRAEDARRPVNMSSSDPALAAYLRGESFRSPGENGWALVCVDGFPLGWGKRVDGTLKSHFPRGLRRM